MSLPGGQRLSACNGGRLLIALLSFILAASEQPSITFLSAPYKHFKYSFERLSRGLTWTGEGELWAWFDGPDVSLRFHGLTSNDRFGKVNITTMINSYDKQLIVNFALTDLDEQQCVIYPLDEPPPRASQREKILHRDMQALEKLGIIGADSGAPAQQQLNISWTRKKRLELKWSPSGEFKGADMFTLSKRFKGMNRIKRLRVEGNIEQGDAISPEYQNVFAIPKHCRPFSKINDPLARIGLNMPHKTSSILSDLVASVQPWHKEWMMRLNSGQAEMMSNSLQWSAGKLMRQVITMNVLALPGDIAVMIEEPLPPNLEGPGTGVKLDYETNSYVNGALQQSNGSMWLNTTERAFRVSGRASNGVLGPAYVNLIARAENARSQEDRARMYSGHLTEQPAIFCNVLLSQKHESQCVHYNYPKRPGSSGISIARSLAHHLRFVEVSELDGEDCGVFATYLANGHSLVLWVDMEEEDHHAIMRVDIRNKTTVLRSTRVLKWHDDASDMSFELLPPPSWHCGLNDTFDPQFASLGMVKEQHGVMDALYAVDKLPMGYAMLELLALPGDLRIEIEETDGSGAYMASPAKRAKRFLDAPYKHFKYSFQRFLGTKEFKGLGELWIWFYRSASGKGEVKLRLRGESKTKKFGRVEVTLVLLSESNTLYVDVGRKDVNNHTQCMQYDLSKTDPSSSRNTKLVQWVTKDILELQDLEKFLPKGVAEDDAQTDEVWGDGLQWTNSKKLNVNWRVDGEFRGIDMVHVSGHDKKPTLVKHMEVIGDVDYGDEVPEDLQPANAQGVFDMEGHVCRPVADINDPIALVMVEAPHHRSSALRDLIAMIDIDADRHMRAVLSFLIFSLPGDVPIMVEEPEPPTLYMDAEIAFDYVSTVNPGPGERHSKGSVWAAKKGEAFHVHGVADTLPYGQVKLDFVARGEGPATGVSANIDLERTDIAGAPGEIHQCLSYEYPADPGTSPNGLANNQAQAFTFRGVAEYRGEDYSTFSAPLTMTGHTIVLWVNEDDYDHHAIAKVEVHNGTTVLRRTRITKWRDEGDYTKQLVPNPEWECAPEAAVRNQLAHYGLDNQLTVADHLETKSSDLHDTLYAMKFLEPGFAFLELLSMPGDLSIAVTESTAPTHPSAGAVGELTTGHDHSHLITTTPLPGTPGTIVQPGVTPAQKAARKASDFLKAPYKHFSYEFERHWGNQFFKGLGQVHLWFQPGGEVKLHFHGESDTKIGRHIIIQILLDTAKEVLQTNITMKEANGHSQCLSYPIPRDHRERIADVSKFMHRDEIGLETLMAAFGKSQGANSPLANLPLSYKATSEFGFELQWTQSKMLRLNFDGTGEFVGLDMFHQAQPNVPIKHIVVIGATHHGMEPPLQFKDVFNEPPAGQCTPVNDVADPLGKMMVNAPHHRSAALNDFFTIMDTDADAHMWPLLSVIVFSLPGDVPVMLELPTPPTLEIVQGVKFDYDATVFPGQPTERKSSGSVWSSIEKRAFHLYGLSGSTPFGHVEVDFIAEAEAGVVYANIKMLDNRYQQDYIQQCIAYKYPATPGSQSSNLAKSASQPLTFRGTAAYQQEDCSVYSAPLTRGRTIFLWVDEEVTNRHAIMKVEVRKGAQILRSTALKWGQQGDAIAAGVDSQMTPPAEWHCTAESQTSAQVLGHFGIDHIRKKSKDLHDTLFAMEDMSPSFAMLELLALPGDLSIDLVADPDALAESLEPGATLPPILAPGAQGGLQPQQTLHSYILVSISLGVSMLTFLSMLILLFVLAAAAIGLPVPLLAALPAVSATAFSLQVVTIGGRTVGPHVGVPSEGLADLCQLLRYWVLPHSSAKILSVSLMLLALVSVLRLVARQRQRAENQRGRYADQHSTYYCPPHGLTFGAWELRALGLAVFPLAAAASELLVEYDSVPVLGPAVGMVVLFALGHTILGAFKFVVDVIEENRVVRANLPQTAGGDEIFVDRECDQLRALPARPPQPGCPMLFGDWLSTPAWSIAPVVSVIHKVEHQGMAGARGEEDMEVGASDGLWCSSADACKNVDAEHESEITFDIDMAASGVEVRPLLHDSSSGEDREGGAQPEAAEANRRGESSQGSSSPSVSAGDSRPSMVSLAHPVKATTACTFDMGAQSLIAGVVCIPWLDCAVPAAALRRVEELCGDIRLQVHPGQLCGPLATGRYAACFDWGTHYPFRWPVELMVKACVGVWIVLPICHDVPDEPATALESPMATLMGLAMTLSLAVMSYGAFKFEPYSHSYDNAALLCSWLVATLTVFVVSFGSLSPDLASLATLFIALLLLISCGFTLLSAVGLAGIMLGRLEVQGLQDRLLPHTIDAWGAGSFRKGGRTSSRSDPSFDEDSPGACGVSPESSTSSGHDAEVVLPGSRPAFAIVLPAVTRSKLAHVQMLPPIAGRSADADSMAIATTAGERARLPLPASMLFPSGPGRHCSGTAPLVALLAPGRPGRLVYEDASWNAEKEEWQSVVRVFFSSLGEQMADETERLVKSNMEQDGEHPITVVEVLPAFAAEFLEEPSPGSRR